MINFLQETITAMHPLTPEDVVYIGSHDVGTTDWAEFEKLADFVYDNGYGGVEIPLDVMIFFKDGSWMERTEYDGSEGWNLRRTPRPPQTYRPLVRVQMRHCSSCFDSLEDRSYPEEDD